MNDVISAPSGRPSQPRPAPVPASSAGPGVKRAKRPHSRLRRILWHPMLIIQLLVLLAIAGLIVALILSRKGNAVPRQAITPVPPTATSTPAATPTPPPPAATKAKP